MMNEEAVKEIREVVEGSVDPVVVEVTLEELEKIDPESVEVFRDEFPESKIVQLTFGYDGFSVNLGKSKQEIANQDVPAYELEWSDFSVDLDNVLDGYLELIK